MKHELKPIRYQSNKHKTLHTLINRVNEERLIEAHFKQLARKAVGVDGMTKDEYGKNLEGNVKDLVQRMKSFQYKPRPVRRTYIPKLNGKLRPLGIPSYEDKLVQKVMADILHEVYEPRFLECSYGFRPGRNAHDVVRNINHTIMGKRVNYVLDADIKGFFDNLDQKWLMKFLAHDIGDKNFLRYIARFLKAGVMEDARIIESDKGTPQGGLISPILANVYLHYVLDLWIEKRVKRMCVGEVHYIRYADDFLILFQVEKEARKVLEWLKERLTQFGLELAEDKTRILPFGRYRGTKEKFDFLGFTFLNAKTRNLKYKVAIISSAKKIKAKRAAAKAWLATRTQHTIAETLKSLNRKLTGHYNYYGVNGNTRELRKFEAYVRTCTLKMLRRRSQRHKMSWSKFQDLWDYYVTKPKIKVDIWTK